MKQDNFLLAIMIIIILVSAFVGRRTYTFARRKMYVDQYFSLKMAVTSL